MCTCENIKIKVININARDDVMCNINIEIEIQIDVLSDVKPAAKWQVLTHLTEYNMKSPKG